MAKHRKRPTRGGYAKWTEIGQQPVVGPHTGPHRSGPEHLEPADPPRTLEPGRRAKLAASVSRTERSWPPFAGQAMRMRPPSDALGRARNAWVNHCVNHLGLLRDTSSPKFAVVTEVFSVVLRAQAIYLGGSKAWRGGSSTGGAERSTVPLRFFRNMMVRK